MPSYRALKADLSVKFKDSVQINDFLEFLRASKDLLSSWKENDFKNIIELTIREVLLDLIKNGADITLLERVFQFSIDAALQDAAAGNVPVFVIGDMFESSTISECEKYFSFVESRVEIFKKDIFFKVCKNHLLRSCNDLLKRLSRSQNTVFCGRILMFLAHIFPLSERSGLNIISEFNLENTTAYSTNDDIFVDLASEKGDVTEEGEISAQNQSSFVVDKNLYQKFWSLQDYFRSPNTCYNKMQWRQFTGCTSDVLTVFGSFKSDDANSSKWKQAKLPSPNGSCVYFAKYLTSPKLLELELSDSHFRRYVLVQFLILFQYLSLPVKFKLESYVLTDEQQNWVKETTKSIYKLLEETPPNGEAFVHDVQKILQREEYWNAWKNEGCPDFKPLSDKAEVEKKLKKRPFEDIHTYPNKKISAEVTKIWNTKPNNWEACRSAKRNFVPSLESYFGIASKAEGGQVIQRRDTTDSKYTWKALRLLCMKSPYIFTANTAPAKSVSEYLDTIVQKVAKEKPQTAPNVVVQLQVGHTAIEKDRPTKEGYTHDWKVFVRGPNDCAVESFIEKVVFHLPDSLPKPKRVIKEPPFQVCESGYAAFTMPIDVYFRTKEEPKKVSYNYDLYLRTGEKVNNVRLEKFTFHNPVEEFRKKLLLGGGHQDNMTVETAVAEDEAMEDANEDFFPASEEDSKDEVKKENVLTKALIQTISGKLQDNWKTLAVKLGFQDDEIEYYETFPDAKAQTEQMLTVWMERDGTLSTFTKILQSAGLLSSVLSLITS